MKIFCASLVITVLLQTSSLDAALKNHADQPKCGPNEEYVSFTGPIQTCTNYCANNCLKQNCTYDCQEGCFCKKVCIFSKCRILRCFY